ncbi:hypothetical protein [Streptomyces sp. NPDC102264]|uniref:hypothetical protein n=1 Tax=Streptomyces sp. NPDC102264 TaxID=3366149 RepID=UPI00380C2E59
MAALAVVRDLREHWAPASAEELERFENDVLSGFVLARASAGLADGTIRGDVGHLDQIRSWLEEAMAKGPDPLHLAEVFGLDEKTAMRYADSALALLQQAAEQPSQ